jgi:hypothetical protein
VLDVEDVEKYRGMDASEIGAAFADVEQDDVTRMFAGVLAERTDRKALPHLPYAVQLTMYGDADVSDWLLVYTSDSVEIREAQADASADIHARWEHWEDAVRLLNGDVIALSLLLAGRISVDGGPVLYEPPWFRAVAFAPGSDCAAHGQVLGGLADASQQGGGAMEQFVAATGVERIAEAGILVIAQAMVESGVAGELEGTSLRTVVPGTPPVEVEVVFGLSAAATDVVQFNDTAAIAGSDDGVTVRYKSADVFVSTAAGERSFETLLVNGLVKVEGADRSLDRFGRALMQFAQTFPE